MSCEPNNQLNVCTTSATEGKVARKKKLVYAPRNSFNTDRSKAVFLTWLSVACFGVRVMVMFHLMFVHYIEVRFWLLSDHLLGNSYALGWPFVLIVFCLLVFYLFPILVLRASAVTMPELVEINLV